MEKKNSIVPRFDRSFYERSRSSGRDAEIRAREAGKQPLFFGAFVK